MKLISILASIFFVSNIMVMNAQNSPVLTLEHVSTTASTANIKITVTGWDDICAGDLKLLYNPAIAVAKWVTVSPGLGGTMSTNLSDPGIIRIGWFTFPGITLSDGSVIFHIEFEKVSPGTTIISFDNSVTDMDCQFYNGSFQTLNDAPFSTYFIPGSLTFSAPAGPVTTLPDLTAIVNENVDIPVTVSGFNKVGGVSLRLEYDPAVLHFNSAANTAGYPGLIINNYVPGIILVSGFINDPEGYSIPDGIFYTLNFRYNGGTTDLWWNDEDGTSCEYAGPQSAFVYSDMPQSHYYINGRVGGCPAPDAPVVIVAQPDCDHSTGTIIVTSPVGTGYTYSIDGNTYQSLATFSELDPGNYKVTVMNGAGCVSSATLVKIETQPPAPHAPSVSITQPSCSVATGTIEITSPTGAGYTYSMNGSNYQSLATFSGLAPNTYSLTVKNAYGCVSATIMVEIEEQPVTPAQPEVKIKDAECGVSGYSSITNYNAAYSYTFTPAGPGIDDNGNITGFTTGQTYTVTATNDAGCESAEPVLFTIEEALTVPATPEITANGPTSFCEGDHVLLTSDEAFSYEWSTGETTQSISASSSGSYTVTVTNIEGYGSTSGIMEVTVVAKPEMPSPVNCWDEFTFNNTTCQWDNIGLEPQEPAEVNCWDDYHFNTNSCQWVNMGTQPTEPLFECYQTAIWNPATCAWDIAGVQPEAPATECWETVAWNEVTCSWDVTGTQTEAPYAECWQTVAWNEVSCSWDVTGTQPAMPAPVNCWDEFTFNNTTCQWDNTGMEPQEPAEVNCWDDYHFNTNTCQWVNMGTQPTKPAVECYQTAIWNPATCAWDIAGAQPEAPATECWETATWNETTCSWDVTGTQPEAPNRECWQTVAWDEVSCRWNVTGTQPAMPAPVNCWDEFTFNNTTCQWDNTGMEPQEPAAVNCWDDYQFNTNICAWVNMGVQPTEPLVECYQTAIWNPATCAWDIAGAQPEAPATECWETVAWNEVTCSWDVTGTQPAIPAPVNCWDEFTFNNTTCQWDNIGMEPQEPAVINCWDDYHFNTNTCAWVNIGIQPTEPLVGCYQTAIWNPVNCAWDVTGTQPEAPATECWETAIWNETTCSWNVTGTQPAMPAKVNCWDAFVFNSATCQWDNTGSEPLEPAITTDGPTEFCTGGSVTLTAGEGISYLWSTGETTQSINITTSGEYTVTATFGNGCHATSAPVTVSVVSASDLIITSLEVNPTNPVIIHTAVTLTVKYSSSLPVDFIVTWDKESVETFSKNMEGSVTSTHTYQNPGIYDVIVEATDVCGNVVTSIYTVVVCNPSETFVTGGGWFNSSLSAVKWMPGKSIFNFIYKNKNRYKNDPDNHQLMVKAHFSFVVRYQNNQSAPSGNVHFYLQKGDLNLTGISFDWLVITDNGQAWFQGSGTINGSGNYGYLIVVVDGGKHGSDRFRIKIWDKDDNDTVIYDNLTVTEIKGSIVFHTPRHKTAIIEQDQKRDPFNDQIEVKVFPNPFSEKFSIEFTTPESVHACVDIYDMNGRLVTTILNRDVESGVVYTAELIPENLTSSFYTYRLTLGNQVYTGKVIYNNQ
jgi:hypothetical protein